MENVVCAVCGGKGLMPKCTACGKVCFDEPPAVVEKKLKSVIIPTWYTFNKWDVSKVVYTKNPGRTKTIEILDKAVSIGELPAFSAMFLLPCDSGKRIAMYTYIQKLLERGHSVSPIVDITSLNILLKRDRFEDQQTLLDLFSADMVFIYSTDFVTRKNAAKIFEGVCRTRSLSGKPTWFFGSHTFKELSSWGTSLSLDKNQIKNDKLAHPLIFDGVAERSLHGQE